MREMILTLARLAMSGQTDDAVRYVRMLANLFQRNDDPFFAGQLRALLAHEPNAQRGTPLRAEEKP